MGNARIDGNLVVSGRVTSQFLDIPDQAVTDARVSSSAGIQASKLQQQHPLRFSDESAATAADKAHALGVVRGNVGSVVDFEAGVVVANIGDSTIAVDLLKNGASILSAAISLSSAQAAYATVVGTIDTPSLVDGDVLEVSIDATVGSGTLGKGLFAQATIREDAD